MEVRAHDDARSGSLGDTELSAELEVDAEEVQAQHYQSQSEPQHGRRGRRRRQTDAEGASILPIG